MEVLDFGTLEEPDAAGRRDVALVPLHSSAVSASVLTYGATLHAVEVPDRAGHRDAVALNVPSLADLAGPQRPHHLGATCGRWANRIRDAAFELDGEPIVLAANDGPHHLHGGLDGFSHLVWDLVEAATTDDGGRVVLSLQRPAGDQGYPGAVTATATYELHGHRLVVRYEATADAATVVNLTNHAYWNLAGVGAWSLDHSIGDHELRVPADRHLPTDADHLPIGGLAPVAGTPWDLRTSPVLADLVGGRRAGLDASYPVDRVEEVALEPDGLHLAAELHHPASGRTLTVRTDQPSIHIYTANHLGPPFGRQAAVCLEAQRFVDAPNHPDLGPAVLRPGERYQATTELTFGVR